MRGNEKALVKKGHYPEDWFQIPMRGNELNETCLPIGAGRTAVSNPHEG